MSGFTRTYWVDNSDPDVTAAELNRIEQGVVDAHVKADDLISQASAALARAEQIIGILLDHIADHQNPHHVTPSQLGLDVVSAKLAAHLADFNNPHQTTVAQAQAAS